MFSTTTIKKILTYAEDKIDPREARLLLAHSLKMAQESIISHPEYAVSWLAAVRFRRLVATRKKGIPLAYLTGHKEFFGLDFAVNKYTLIPRPETEMIVEAVLDTIKKKKLTAATVIDVGTGSGCIPISIAKNIRQNLATIIAIDISRRALRVAQRNAKKYDADVTFLRGNLLDPIKLEVIRPFSHIFITANLPYLTAAQFAEEPTIHHEPKSALVAEDDGLALYEKLLQHAKSKLSNSQAQIFLFLEIDPSQSRRIEVMIKKYFPRANIEIKKDLAGRDRIVVCTLTS